MIIANSALPASLASYHSISNARSWNNCSLFQSLLYFRKDTATRRVLSASLQNPLLEKYYDGFTPIIISNFSLNGEDVLFGLFSASNTLTKKWNDTLLLSPCANTFINVSSKITHHHYRLLILFIQENTSTKSKSLIGRF